jgi:hypothetical protein
MNVTLELLGIATSVALFGWLGVRDPKRRRAQSGDASNDKAFTISQRRVVAIAATLPGLLFALSGRWSSAVLWLGATATLSWVWVLWLARFARPSASG